MKLKKHLFVIIYIFIFLLNDPKLTFANTMDGTFYVNAYTYDFSYDMKEEDTDTIYISYALNGGINNVNNLDKICTSELPMKLEIPTKAGYNFAGWYTDASYKNKITEINASCPSQMLLFAKWTKEIDSYYNVEMYSYSTNMLSGQGQKKLRNCSYRFIDELTIPGMPATRVQDYLSDVILSESQCVQGLCFTPEYILMTAYTESNELPGALMVFDRETASYIATVSMKQESHLGGIAFDGENIWICHSNSNTLERIAYDDLNRMLLESEENHIDVSNVAEEYKLKNTPSCITCYGGRLWVATYSKFFHSEMVSYNFDEKDGKLVALSEYRIPARVQGVAFDTDGTVYLSTSLGRNNSSYLKGYSSLLSMTKNPDEPAIKVEMPPCSEEIAVVDENIYVLFESASEKYFEGTDGNGTSTSPIDKILAVEVASIW